MTKPYGYVEGRKYPGRLPHPRRAAGQFRERLELSLEPAGLGRDGLCGGGVDFHGSTGYGADFGQSIIGHWGDRPLEDLQKGWAAALSRYAYLDGNRACALGGSYGGYMIDWIASQWSEPWKCLVDHAGVFDVRSQAWAMDSARSSMPSSGRRQQDWERFNPAAYANRWKMPILVIHGGKDFRVPTEQGIAPTMRREWRACLPSW